MISTSSRAPACGSLPDRSVRLWRCFSIETASTSASVCRCLNCLVLFPLGEGDASGMHDASRHFLRPCFRRYLFGKAESPFRRPRSSLVHFHIVLRHRQTLSGHEPCRPEFALLCTVRDVRHAAEAPCRRAYSLAIRGCRPSGMSTSTSAKALHSRWTDLPIVLDSKCSQNTPLSLPVLKFSRMKNPWKVNRTAPRPTFGLTPLIHTPIVISLRSLLSLQVGHDLVR